MIADTFVLALPRVGDHVGLALVASNTAAAP